MIAPGSSGAGFALRPFRKGRAHATASVRITNVARFITGLTLLASSGRETKKSRETAVTVLPAYTRPARAHARYRMTCRVEGSCLITSARLATTTRANIPVSNLKMKVNQHPITLICFLFLWHLHLNYGFELTSRKAFKLHITRSVPDW